ncbi:pleiotropic drug resistance protein 3-like protein [Carex littledalei]|uniref:Pleiotropic drug resistance protein 3-like protein n=1 Tax=Carex littledalei TaxID=544730 RepID=A0A833RCL2_9POAL|nr:pleiotropic drug resistance protein 3-like protein [Carex littledalei]
MERKREEDSGDIHQMERSIRQSFSEAALSFRRSLSGGDKEESGRNEEEELQQQWAAIERLPTYDRLRTSLFFQHQHVDDQNNIGEGEKRVPVDVGQLGPVEMHHFIETQIKHIEKDNLRFLQKQRSRIDRVNMKQPTIEVRYKNLSVEAECEVVQGTPLPTLWNSLMSMISIPAFLSNNIIMENEIKVKKLSTPSPGSSDLRFETRYPQKFLVQFKACLWKQSLSYWRSPEYNMTRIIFMFITSVALGLLFWNQGGKINNQQDLFSILGCMYCATLFTGFKNGSTTVPFVSVERTIVYRENFAGMYSPWAYSFAQVAIEIPYVLFQVVLFMIIAYPAIGFEWNAGKFMWFFYGLFCNILCMIYFGMMLTAMTPTVELAIILQMVFYHLLNLFSGFVVPRLYGDVPKLIVIFGEEKSVMQFLEDYFGFCHDRLPLVAVILALYPIIFATIFAYFIGRINFQKR